MIFENVRVAFAQLTGEGDDDGRFKIAVAVNKKQVKELKKARDKQWGDKDGEPKQGLDDWLTDDEDTDDTLLWIGCNAENDNPSHDLDYIVGAVARILHVLRLTPKINSGDNAVSAKGARTVDMCVPILMLMRDGAVGRVMYDPATKETSVRTCTQAQADANAVAQQSGCCVATYVFVPAHPNLHAVLPNALPPGVDQALASLFQNMMRRKRCISVALDSILTTPDVDPVYFCLDHYMIPRVDVLGYYCK